MSQQREFEFGGPDVAEQGDALRAPGGTVDVTAIPVTGADDWGGGDADVELLTGFWKEMKNGIIN